MITKGSKVRVVNCADEITDSKYMGLVGIAVDTETRGICGDSPTDPMWIVQFARGVRDGFWTEELATVPQATPTDHVPEHEAQNG